MKTISKIGLRLKSLILLSFILVFISCDGDDSPDVSKRKYVLTWEDNFDGSVGTSPDANTWTYDLGTGQDGWGNNELQYYTSRPENVSMDGEGNLVITAIEESYEGRSYTSGRIKTQGLKFQTYGRFEARIKTPYGRGLWPAFWMLGTNIETAGWPLCGEIDIMELVGHEPDVVYGTVHGPGYSGGDGIGRSYSKGTTRFNNDFHVFAIEWTEDLIEFYVDNDLYHTITPSEVPGEWVYDTDFFIILNVAVGGNWPGAPSITTTFPQEMVVDFVRVYEEL